MGVIQSFERRLQGAVGNTFARMFGGTVQPAEVADALQREVADHVHHQGNRTIAPNSFRVRLGPTDREVLGADEASVGSALSDMIREYLDEQGYQTFGDVAVTLEQSDSLHTGQFRISSIVDPDVDRRSRNSRAGVGLMTQQPGDQNRDQQRDPSDRGDDPRRGDQQYGPGGYQQYGPPPGYQQPYGGPGGSGGPGGPGYGQQPWEQGQPWEQQPYGPPPQGYPPQPPQPPQGPQGPQPWEQGYPPQPPPGQGQWDQRGQGYPPQYGQQGQGQQGYGQGYPQNYPQQYGAPQQDVVATLSVDDGSGRSYQLQRGSNVVGRGQDAAFRLPDTSVSRRHVDIYFDGQSAVLHDLGSTNGTTVNGSSVQTWQLADGDVIHIGHSTVVFASRY